MDNLTNELRRLREDNMDVELILNIYGEIERVYRDTLKAMGLASRYAPEAADSAKVTVSFRPTQSSSGY